MATQTNTNQQNNGRHTRQGDEGRFREIVGELSDLFGFASQEDVQGIRRDVDGIKATLEGLTTTIADLSRKTEEGMKVAPTPQGQDWLQTLSDALRPFINQIMGLNRDAQAGRPIDGDTLTNLQHQLEQLVAERLGKLEARVDEHDKKLGEHFEVLDTMGNHLFGSEEGGGIVGALGYNPKTGRSEHLDRLSDLLGAHQDGDRVVTHIDTLRTEVAGVQDGQMRIASMVGNLDRTVFGTSSREAQGDQPAQPAQDGLLQQVHQMDTDLYGERGLAATTRRHGEDIAALRQEVRQVQNSQRGNLAAGLLAGLLVGGILFLIMILATPVNGWVSFLVSLGVGTIAFCAVWALVPSQQSHPQHARRPQNNGGFNANGDQNRPNDGAPIAPTNPAANGQTMVFGEPVR
jgi:hypothetical protein